MSYTNQDRVVEVRNNLQTISESLSELSMDTLRNALDAGESAAPPEDKKINQARRAVDKAIKTLEFD